MALALASKVKVWLDFGLESCIDNEKQDNRLIIVIIIN